MSLRQVIPTSRGVLPSVVRLIVTTKPQQWGDLGPLGAVEPWNKNKTSHTTSKCNRIRFTSSQDIYKTDCQPLDKYSSPNDKLFIYEGKKVKVALWGFLTLRPFGLLYSYPQQVPAFISRGATHHTNARNLYQRRWEILPMNFASKSVIYEYSLGSFTCCKAGTWDIFFYFPSEGRHTEDFPDTRKFQRLRPGLNPRNRVPVTSMLTTRPPKPSFY